MPASVWPVMLLTGARVCCYGPRSASWQSAAADMVSAAFRSTILQQAASDDLRGRLQGVFVVVVAGGPRLADAAHGAAAAIFGTAAAVVGGGVLVVVGVLIAAVIAPAFVRYRAPSDPAQPPRQAAPDAGPNRRAGA